MMKAQLALLVLIASVAASLVHSEPMLRQEPPQTSHDEHPQETQKPPQPFDPGKTELTPGTPEAPGPEAHEHEPGAHVHEHGAEAQHLEGAARFIAWLGKFHPLTVHIPIALLLAAGLAELLVVWRSPSALGAAARYCLIVAAAGAVISAPLRWANAAYGDHPANLHGTLESHRWFGMATAMWIVFTVIASELHIRSSASHWRRIYRLLLFFGAILVSITGHLGATLIYGPGYYSW